MPLSVTCCEMEVEEHESPDPQCGQRTVCKTLEVIGCRGAPKKDKRGSGEMVVLYAVLSVLKIPDQTVASLQIQHICECSTEDCLHLLHESVTLG